MGEKELIRFDCIFWLAIICGCAITRLSTLRTIVYCEKDEAA
jgi:hypothetical protein